MILRGEYRRSDGHVTHNAFTTAGLAGILASAFRDIWPAAGVYVGLCQAVPSAGLTLANIEEPTIGVNGYARQPIARSLVGWPVAGTVGNDPFLESLPIVFTATGGDFDLGVSRLFLTPEQTATAGELWGLSGAISATLIIGPATPLNQRTFNYRIYGN